MGLESRFFTFGSLISQDHDFIIGFYTVLCALITILISKLATRKMQLIPSGLQNIYEVVIEGILSVAKDVIGEQHARKYFPLQAR